MATLEKDKREDVYNRADTRELPLVFVDDNFVGVRSVNIVYR